MSKNVDALFNPFSLKGLSLANRIVMAAMNRESTLNSLPISLVAAVPDLLLGRNGANKIHNSQHVELDYYSGKALTILS